MGNSLEYSSPKRRKFSHPPRNAQLGNGAPGNDEAIESESMSDLSSNENAASEFSKHSSLITNDLKDELPPANRPFMAIQSTGSGTTQTIGMLTDELLSQVRPNYQAQRARAQPILDELKEAIRKVKPRAPLPVQEAERVLKKESKVAIPFPTPRPSADTKYFFEYSPPFSVEHIGLRSLDLHLKGPGIHELLVVMPPALFQKKDFLNLRAFHKRAYYLACLTCGLKSVLNSDFNFHYEHQDGNELLPTLVLVPKPASSTKNTVRITVGFPQGVFELDKTSPIKNCLRSAVSTEADSEPNPTPFYNSTLNLLSGMAEYQALIEKACSSCKGFADACRLGQIWLQQRGIDSGTSNGAFGPWDWTVMCTLLLQGGGPRGTPAFSSRYSALTLFKSMISFLATRDLRSPFFIGSAADEAPTSDYPCLFDSSRGVNVVFKMTPWSYNTLRLEAKKSLEILRSQEEEEQFDRLFIHRLAAPLLCFDESITLRASPKLVEGTNQNSSPAANFQWLYEIVSQGLGDRIDLVSLSTPSTPPFEVQQESTKQDGEAKVTINLLLNPENADRLVDRGPFEGDRGQAEFRRFWGDKAELRRFKDNAVARESVVWSENSSTRLQIISHLLHHHFDLSTDTVNAENVNLEQVLLRDDSDSNISDSFAIVSKTFQTLTNTLLNLSTLPIRLHSVYPASPQLSSSSLQSPATPNSTPSPITVVVEFESSPNWPDSLPAIQYTKLAFLMKIADVLDTQNADLNLTTRVGVENESSSTRGHLNTSYLDIIFPSPKPGVYSPIPFRIRIRHDREEHLIRAAQVDKSLHGSLRDTLESALQLQKRAALSSAHIITVRDLCHKFPKLSPTIRLFKKWTASHLLTSLVPSEIIETIAASVFTEAYPLDPGTLSLSFLSCLKKIADWSWQDEPLIVNLKISDLSSLTNSETTTATSSRKFTQEQLAAFNLRHSAWRDIDPSMHRVAATVFTSLDPTGVALTQIPKDPLITSAASIVSDYEPGSGGAVMGLSALALNRWQAVARISTEVIEGQAGAGRLGRVEWMSIFQTSTKPYDFVIHLTARLVRGESILDRRDGLAHKERKEGKHKFKNLALAPILDGHDEEMIGFDPVDRYITDLKRVFGRACVFFYGPGSAVIGGLWLKRGAQSETMQFRVRNGLNVKPRVNVGDDGEHEQNQVEVNRMAVVDEIAKMGEGIVSRLEFAGTEWKGSDL